MYLHSLEYFRGVAIVFIVAGHCYVLSDWQFPTVLERSLANVLTASTALFVFISGFLFHHVFYPRFNYVKFIKKSCGMSWPPTCSFRCLVSAMP